MGKLKNIIKKTALYKLYRKIHTFLFYNPTELGAIYMLHRVDTKDEQKLSANENMKVSPELLEAFINRLKEQGVKIIPLGLLPEFLKKNKKEQFAVFTMDDGYKDNYTEALPVFRKLNVPYTIFLTTDFPDNKAVLWWYELEDLLLKKDSIKLSNGKSYPAKTKKEKEESFLAVREEILKLNQLKLSDELNRLFSDYEINWTQKCSELCLSWDDVAQLKKDSLVSFGGHTKHHFNLKALPDSQAVVEEINSGLEILSQHGIEPEIFAYPFGSENECSEREFKILSKMSVKLAVRACGGSVKKRDIRNMYSLPREFLTEDYINNYLDNIK